MARTEHTSPLPQDFVYQEFPKTRHHKTETSKIVHTIAQEESETPDADGWVDDLRALKETAISTDRPRMAARAPKATVDPGYADAAHRALKRKAVSTDS